jgi:hypothetical protein
MAHERRTLRSLSELTVPPKPFVPWDVGAVQLRVIDTATKTLCEWLHGRITNLRREKVPLEDITVSQSGVRTIVSVRGVERFSVKLKLTLEE